jgi:hypothetical protein
MKKILIIPVLTLLIAGVFSSCDIQTPSLDIAISTDFMSNVATINFITDVSNSAIGNLVRDFDGAKSKVTISGPDAESVYNLLGERNFKVNGGALHLLLHPSADLNSRPYTVNVLFEAAGYLSRNVTVTFSKDNSDIVIQVPVVNKANLPSGISIATSSTATMSTSTGLDEKVVLAASNASTEGVSTEITIPAGIKMKDSNGSLLSGKLKAEVISFSEGNGGTAFLPGGMTPNNVILEDGSQVAGSFVSAGFATINMSVGNNRVSSFEGGNVDVKMTLSKTNFNPETGAPYKVGDTIVVWSYDEANGQWKFVYNAIIKADTNNTQKGMLNLFLDFIVPIDDFPFPTIKSKIFNIGFLSPMVPDCQDKTVTVKWPGADIAVNTSVKVNLVSNLSGGYTYKQQVFSGSFAIKNNSVHNLGTFPNNMDIEVVIFDADNNREIFRKVFAEGTACSISTIDITEPYVKKPTVSITYSAKCGSVLIYPPATTTFYFKEAGSTLEPKVFYTVTTETANSNTIVSDKIEVGKTYEFSVFAAGENQTGTYTIESASNFIDVVLPDDACGDGVF